MKCFYFMGSEAKKKRQLASYVFRGKKAHCNNNVYVTLRRMCARVCVWNVGEDDGTSKRKKKRNESWAVNVPKHTSSNSINWTPLLWVEYEKLQTILRTHTLAAGKDSFFIYILKMLSKKIISGRSFEIFFFTAAAMTFHLLPTLSLKCFCFFYNAIYFLHSMTSRVTI